MIVKKCSRAFSTRVCASMWWFFALIVTQSYTANWTAFLTSSRKESAIKRVEDLDKQSAIKYGCVRGQSTASFFEVISNLLFTYHLLFIF
jgi:glutamate receptor, ionotropic, invertebrate